MSLQLQARPFGRSGQFNGVNNAVTLGSPADLQRTGAQTWACWFSAPRPQTATLMGRNTGATATTLGFRLSLLNGKALLSVGDGRGVFTTLASPLLSADRQWHHVAGVYTGTALLLYIDGLLVASTGAAVPVSLARATLPLALGARGNGAGDYFLGWLDDAQIYNRGLAAPELANLYTLGLYAQPWPDAALLSWWDFNEGTGRTVADSVGGEGGTWVGALGSQWSAYVPDAGRVGGGEVPATPPASPTLTRVPESGVAGTVIAVQGADFTPAQSVTLTFTPVTGTPALVTPTVASDGTFAGSLTVAGDNAVGLGIITATTGAGDMASVTFEVTAPPPPPPLVFPDLNAGTAAAPYADDGLAFAYAYPLGAADARTNRSHQNEACKLQWNDYIPAQGAGKFFEFGGIIYYPWGWSRATGSGPTPSDYPHGAMVIYRKPRATPGAPSPADIATAINDFRNLGYYDNTSYLAPGQGAVAGASPTPLAGHPGCWQMGNWYYIQMQTLCAADPWVSFMHGRGGGSLDDPLNPTCCYMPGNFSFPNPADAAHSYVRTRNPVHIRLDISDPTAPGSYATLNLPKAMDDHGWAGVTGGHFASTWADHGSAYFMPVKAGTGENARLWYPPVTNHPVQSPNLIVVSMDAEPAGANYFSAAQVAHWHWADMQGKLGNFGSFQGALGKGSYAYFIQSGAALFWRINADGPRTGHPDETGRDDPAANVANWTSFDPGHTIAAAATGDAGNNAKGYLNGTILRDGRMLFSPFAPHTPTGATPRNSVALLYNPAYSVDGVADRFGDPGAWQGFDLWNIPVDDPNDAANHCNGYQAITEDNSGYVWFMPTWDEAADPARQAPWVCWNPAGAFTDARSWKAYKSYNYHKPPTSATTYTAIYTMPIWSCSDTFDPTINAIFAAPYGGGAFVGDVASGRSGSGTAGQMPMLTIPVLPNGAGIPSHP